MNISENKKYEGGYLHNWFHGKGKYYFDNGVIYEGSFNKGEFHGEGVMYYPNGVSIVYTISIYILYILYLYIYIGTIQRNLEKWSTPIRKLPIPRWT